MIPGLYPEPHRQYLVWLWQVELACTVAQTSLNILKAPFSTVVVDNFLADSKRYIERVFICKFKQKIPQCQQWPCHQVTEAKHEEARVPSWPSRGQSVCLIAWVWDCSSFPTNLSFFPPQRRFLSDESGEEKKNLSKMEKVKKQIEQEKTEVQMALEEAESITSGEQRRLLSLWQCGRSAF